MLTQGRSRQDQDRQHGDGKSSYHPILLDFQSHAPLCHTAIVTHLHAPRPNSSHQCFKLTKRATPATIRASQQLQILPTLWSTIVCKRCLSTWSDISVLACAAARRSRLPAAAMWDFVSIVNGQCGERCSVVYCKLRENVVQVNLDCACGQFQPPSNLLVWKSLRHQVRYLTLASRQHRSAW